MTASQFVIGCEDLEDTIDWFTTVGFRLVMLRPADDPSVALVNGHGLTIRLDRSLPPGANGLRIEVSELPDETTVVAPNGTVIEFVLRDTSLHVPDNDPVFVHHRSFDAAFGSGRAGMQYRDLIPERQGGRYIASHISIPNGGPVPDYVHHHQIRFQMIFCHSGWADLVYEDQGPSFRFEAGDCVLQPPHIRHRVLETSDEFEVVEIGSPAVHDTFRDHDLVLPTESVDPERDFEGQRFVWHRASHAIVTPWRFGGFGHVGFGIDAATDGLADVGLVRAEPGAALPHHVPDHEFLFWFIRAGRATLHRNDETHPLVERDAVTFVPNETYALTEISDDFEILEVRVA
jgi:quercetin dioxygenase-like cupin family protein